jgi:sugar O-acyltransferase (sialic acid O-acetyltransferase NeuD family)
MSKLIAIFGAGGFAREVLQIILDINERSPSAPPWRPVGFIVDEPHSVSNTVHGLPVMQGLGWLARQPDMQLVIGVGNSAARRRIAVRIKRNCGNAFATLVHPLAWVGRHVNMDHGVVVCAGTQITTDIRLGAHVHVNIGSTIGHDAILEDFVTLNPGVNVSGNVTLGEGCEVGTNSVLVPHANVGPWSVVGAGSVVTRPLPGNVTAVGAPARMIKTRQPGWHEESTG